MAVFIRQGTLSVLLCQRGIPSTVVDPRAAENIRMHARHKKYLRKHPDALRHQHIHTLFDAKRIDPEQGCLRELLTNV